MTSEALALSDMRRYFRQVMNRADRACRRSTREPLTRSAGIFGRDSELPRTWRWRSVRIADGTIIRVAAPTGQNGGSDVTLAVRPEKMSIVPGAPGKRAGRPTVVITTRIYAGPALSIFWKTADGMQAGSLLAQNLRPCDGGGRAAHWYMVAGTYHRRYGLIRWP